MESQKLEDALALALSVLEQEGKGQLPVENSLFDGFTSEDDSWELIVKYNGDLSGALSALSPGIGFEPLIAGYGIVTIPQSLIEAFTTLPEVEYVEKPQKVNSQVAAGLADACFGPVLTGAERGEKLDGRGVWCAVIDSGIEYTKDIFRTADGASKLAWIYDQTTDRLFTKQEIEESLKNYDDAMRMGEAFQPLLTDLSGHGTNVAQILTNAAPGSSLVAVKLAQSRANGFILTTNLMRAVSYVVKKAGQERMPVAMNISYGNSYGSHDGTSILERFMDNAAEIGRNVICVSAGNEGAEAGHFSGVLPKNPGSRLASLFSVGRYERNLSLQIWSYPADVFDAVLLTPTGQQYEIRRNPSQGVSQSVRLGATQLDIFCGTAKPYQAKSQIFISFTGINAYIDGGNWELRLISRQIKNGTVQMYLPAQEARSSETRFLFPNPYATVTIPATAGKVLTVGAYASDFTSYAPFSGRGYYENMQSGNEQLWEIRKPDLVAPGVGIRLDEGEKQITVSGTSYAAPFVTGAAAILMQWGIVLGNDPYMYGEKVKAALQKGARDMATVDRIPNALTGWGRLCVYLSLPTG